MKNQRFWFAFDSPQATFSCTICDDIAIIFIRPFRVRAVFAWPLHIIKKERCSTGCISGNEKMQNNLREVVCTSMCSLKNKFQRGWRPIEYCKILVL